MARECQDENLRLLGGKTGNAEKFGRLIYFSITFVFLFITSMNTGCLNQEKSEVEISLFNYQEIFQKEVIIVVGTSEHVLEMEGAQTIAETLMDVPEVASDSEITDGDRKQNNLVLLGNASTNEIIREILRAVENPLIYEEHQTCNEGVLELVKNPWNPKRFALVVAGGDPQKTRDMCRFLSCGCIRKENGIAWIVIDFSTEFISVCGFPVVIGNEPFSHIAIDTGEERISVTGSFSQDLRNLQYVQIEVEGFLQCMKLPSFRTEKSICVTDFRVVNECEHKEVIA